MNTRFLIVSIIVLYGLSPIGVQASWWEFGIKKQGVVLQATSKPSSGTTPPKAQTQQILQPIKVVERRVEVPVQKVIERVVERPVNVDISKIERRLTEIESRLDGLAAYVSLLENRQSQISTTYNPGVDDLESRVNVLQSNIEIFKSDVDDYVSCVKKWNLGSGPTMQDDMWHCARMY